MTSEGRFVRYWSKEFYTEAHDVSIGFSTYRHNPSTCFGYTSINTDNGLHCSPFRHFLIIPWYLELDEYWTNFSANGLLRWNEYEFTLLFLPFTFVIYQHLRNWILYAGILQKIKFLNCLQKQILNSWSYFLWEIPQSCKQFCVIRLTTKIQTRLPITELLQPIFGINP